MPRAASLFLALLSALAAPRSPAQETPVTLHGQVLDAVTGRPLPHTLVSSQDRRLGAFTDTDGRFSFTLNLLPTAPKDLDLNFTAAHPGYLPQEAETILTAGTLADLTLRLTPSSSISGHVSAPGVDAPAAVIVQLYTGSTDEGGSHRWQPTSTQLTNSHGDFAFTDLAADDYAIGTKAWLGDELAPPRTGPAQQYPAAFYGGSADVNSSLKIHLAAGTTARADLPLHLATYYPVHIPIQGKPAEGRLSLSVVGTDIESGLPFRYVPATSLYECWFQPGAHTLNFTSAGEAAQYAQLIVNVLDQPLRTAPVALRPMISIPVRVHLQFSHQDQKSDYEKQLNALPNREFVRSLGPVSLVASATGDSTQSARYFGQSEKPFLSPLPPGTYRVGMPQVPHGYVAALSSGSTNLMRQSLILGDSPSPTPIDVTLRDDGATITATIDYGSGPHPHQLGIILLPADRFDVSFNNTQTDGTFKIENLAPGTYRAFATGEGINFRALYSRDPALMQRIDAKAITLNALPDQHLTLKVPFIDLPTPPAIVRSGIED